jgi:hypothetical protein
MDATALLQDLSDAVDVELADTFGIYDDGSDWREVPVPLAEFVMSKEHLGLTPLYALQQLSMDRLLGDDPQSIYTEPGVEGATREFQIAVLLWGKGSGKDYLCSIVVCYLVYILLCLRDPQRYFEFGRGEAIDVVNVAYNADQAKKVFFEKLKQRMFGWRWLREQFEVYESGRLYGDPNPGKPQVQINDGWVQFPRHIRCFSRHSQNESYEGYNIIAWVMDEASAFLSKAERENADKIYQTLRTSAASRFMRRWVGFIISYPRHGDDFTMTKHAEAERDPSLGIMADGPRKTWEVNTRLGRGQFKEVRPGHEVPIELANDYLLDYEAAIARYECDPPSARDAFFRFPDRLDDALASGRAPLVEWEPVVTRRTVSGPDGRPITRRYSGVKLTKLGKVRRGTRIFAHGDPGLKHDSFSLCLGHGVPATIIVHMPVGEVLTDPRDLARFLAEDPERTPETLIEWEQEVVRTVIDAVIVWNPDFKNDQQVDLLNVREVILELRKHYKIGFAAKEPTFTFDQWNSAETIQHLQAKHVNVEDESWSGPFQLAMFRNARSCFYNDLVTLPDTPSVTSTDPLAPGALYEFKRLELIEDRKVDHPEGGSKDIADSIARVIQHVTGAAKSGFAFGTAYGHKSLNEGTGAIIPSGRPPIDPNATPKQASEHAQEREKERRLERPLGELDPATGSVNGRRLAYTSVRSR